MKRQLFVVILLAPLGAVAHHSPAAFDQSRSVVIEGTVTEYKWGNPHVYLAVETVDATGATAIQQIEAGPAAQLAPRGVTGDLLHPGDRVSLRAYPNRAGPGKTVLGLELTTADGSTYPLHGRVLSSLGASETRATSIAGTWVPQPEGYMHLAATLRSWPFTDAGRAAIEAQRGALRSNQLACVPAGTPSLMSNSIVTTVAVAADRVTFDIDRFDTRRTVLLDQTHPADVTPTALGHSVGHWEDGTLVVDTVGLLPHAEGLGFQFPASAAKHTVERFSLSDDRRHLNYEILVEDPVYLAKPLTFSTQWDYRPNDRPSGAPCDEDSARRFLDE